MGGFQEGEGGVDPYRPDPFPGAGFSSSRFQTLPGPRISPRRPQIWKSRGLDFFRTSEVSVFESKVGPQIDPGVRLVQNSKVDPAVATRRPQDARKGRKAQKNTKTSGTSIFENQLKFNDKSKTSGSLPEPLGASGDTRGPPRTSKSPRKPPSSLQTLASLSKLSAAKAALLPLITLAWGPRQSELA